MERGFAIRLSNAFTILKKTGKEQEKGHSLDGETKQLQHSSLVSKTSGNYSSVYSTDMSVNDLGDPDDRSARDRQSV